MKFGVSFLRLRPTSFVDVTQAAEELGYESVWLSDHLVLPAGLESSPYAGTEHPPIPPELPVFDAPAVLAHLAAHTRTIRLGTWVYVLPLRHPFVAARSFATLDVLSGGRAEVGVGVGWLAGEFAAAGIDFASRGRRADETLDVCRRLWNDPTVEHHGEFFSFGPVAFEPKPIQRPGPRVHVGGESTAALRRAVRFGDGWLSMEQTPETIVALIARLRAAEEAAGRTAPLEVTAAPRQITVVGDAPGPGEIARFEAAGVDRLIVSPWRRTSEAIDGLERFAKECDLSPKGDTP
jgi:probable F420-dependent oxidoreductase